VTESLTPRGVFRVTVSPDEQAAYLEVAPPQPDHPPVDVDIALAYLAEAGVAYGVDAEDVAVALEKRGTAVLVAQGRPPVDGEDGRLEVAANLLEIGGRPRVGDDGTVDLFDLALIHNVSVGQVLARRVPPVPGEAGMTVRGRVLPPHAGRPVLGAAGRGTKLKPDTLEIVAAVAGHAVIVGDQIDVSAIYQVRGDVGVATGHIEFVGSVVVRGDVRPGFRLQADGNVEIHGNVNGGTIEAGGSVSVRFGILGQARIVAAGTVRAKFVEYADVQAGAEVWVSDGIVQSKVSAGTKVEVLGRYGSVVGGHVFARKSLTARELGSSRGIPTTIEVGAAPGLLPESEKLTGQQTELAKKIQAHQVRLKYFAEQASAGRLNRIGANEMESTTSQLQVLIVEKTKIATRQREVAEMLGDLGVAYVDAQKICHPEVRVVIGTDVLVVRKTQPYVRFRHSAATSHVEMIDLDSVHVPR
jgi:uncharacterized protein (DUF342 family)